MQMRVGLCHAASVPASLLPVLAPMPMRELLPMMPMPMAMWELLPMPVVPLVPVRRGAARAVLPVGRWRLRHCAGLAGTPALPGSVGPGQ